MRAWAAGVVVLVTLAGCGARTALDGDEGSRGDAGSADVLEAPLDLAARFSVSVSAEGVARASGYFWRGAREPSPGGGGASWVLGPGESVSVNGAPLARSQADWALMYQSLAVPDRDGRWTFRFVLGGGRVVERTLVLQPPQWAGPDPEAASLAGGLTLRWAPAFPAESVRRGGLSSCVLADRVAVGLDAMTVWGRLTASPCMSVASVSATVTASLAPPFREGAVSASVGLERRLRVLP